MERIDSKEVSDRYNSIQEIWSKEDKWHYWTYKLIKKFISNIFLDFPVADDLRILNAGSAGYSYGLPEKNIIHIDIAEKKLSGIKNAIIASIENIPLQQNSVDFIICVGSVINYCDPVKVIEEFNRILIKGGYIILEFENSNTLELLGTDKYNKKATMVDTFYYGDERIWFFSEQFIRELVESNGMQIIKKDKCHVLSPFIYRITKRENFSALFGIFDFLLKFFPVSSNTIFLISK